MGLSRAPPGVVKFHALEPCSPMSTVAVGKCICTKYLRRKLFIKGLKGRSMSRVRVLVNVNVFPVRLALNYAFINDGNKGVLIDKCFMNIILGVFSISL